MTTQIRFGRRIFTIYRLIACCGLALILALMLLQLAAPRSHAAGSKRQPLSFEDRVAAQRAIEAVYHRHRIWPKDNPQPKPSLDEVMPESAIDAKVEDYLRKSQALEVYWQRPITGEQLQAEMERMARQTKQPEMLRELWEALGNDPFTIAECLARPLLAERKSRSLYATDDRFHDELKRRAAEERNRFAVSERMSGMSGKYHETEWIIPDGPDNAEKRQEQVSRLANLLGVTGEKIEGIQAPIGQLSELLEDETRFYTAMVSEKGEKLVKIAWVEWEKMTFDEWRESLRRGIGLELTAPAFEYRLPEIEAIPNEHAWMSVPPTDGSVPSGRSNHTAVWTGVEMIIWGGFSTGFSSNEYYRTGGRYNPATDAWTPTSTFYYNTPEGRHRHTAVWTGIEMLVWGGTYRPFLSNTDRDLGDGGRYNPATNSWRPIPYRSDLPGARSGHTAIWTGAEMIIWGGGERNVGGRYNPANNSWRATSTANAPSTRSNHTATWTGNEMIVWGGSFNNAFNTGGRYDPAKETWVETNANDAPGSRSRHTAIWTGSEMILWGGLSDGSSINTGGRYNPSNNSWTPVSTTNAPNSRSSHTAVWTGAEMIIWGGNDNTGGRYNPANNNWTATSTNGAPTSRTGHTSVWAGSEMIVWGGNERNTGGRYNPATNSWTTTNTCSYSIGFNAPDIVPANGLTVNVTVSAVSGCNWSTRSNASWLTIVGSADGSGNGTFSYSVAANTTPDRRSGTLTIAGRTIYVMQDGTDNPAPDISYLSKDFATAGGSPLMVTINGEGFVSNSVARVNDSPRATTFISRLALTFSLTAADLATEGLLKITVFNPAPGGGVSNPINFAVNPANGDFLLVSDSSRTGSLAAPPPGACTVFYVPEYLIQAPARATRLIITVSGSRDVDLYVRFGNRVTVDLAGAILADYKAESTDTTETITITPSSSPPLRAGTYYIALGNCGPGSSSFTLRANIEANNELDQTFGAGGLVSTAFVGTFSARANALLIQPDSKLVAVGRGGQGFALARYNSNGSLDAGFGNGGQVTTNPGGELGSASAAALQPDGKIIAAGGSGFLSGGGSLPVLARYLSNGNLDSTFGNGGKVAIELGNGFNYIYEIALQPDGKIVAVGSDFDGFALARYLSDGSLDTTFGIGGRVSTIFSGVGSSFARAVALQPDGKIVVTGSDTDERGFGAGAVLARYHSDGSLDASFGNDGKVVTIFGGSNAIAIQPDGKIITAGGFPFFQLARYNRDGSLDRNFGSSGRVTANFVSGADYANAIALQPDGRIVAAGYAFGGKFAVVCYRSDGSLDTSFSDDGQAIADLSTSEGALDVAIQRDGKIVLAGEALTGNNFGFGLLRYDGGNVCVFAINPASQSFTATGAAGNVAVTAGNGCSWTASSNANWMTITSGSSGSGNGTVNYTVATNVSNSPRTGTIAIAGQTFTVNQAAAVACPTVSSINPTNGAVGSTVTVTGANFTGVMMVKFVNNLPATFTVNSDTQITAIVPNGSVSGPITISKQGCTDLQTGVFTITNPSPTLTSLNPPSAIAGSSGFALTVIGKDFVNGAVVRWNGGDRSTAFVSNTQLTASIGAADIATAGAASVTVFNPVPGGGVSGARSFTIEQPNPLPSISFLDPKIAPVGGDAFTLTVTGKWFVSGSVVRWNDSDRPTTFISRTQLRAAIPATDLTSAGTAVVKVFNPAPGGGLSDLGIVRVTEKPTITDLSPHTVITGGSPFTLKVTGINFNQQSKVQWNGDDRPTTFVSSRELTAAIKSADVAAAGFAAIKVVPPLTSGGSPGFAALLVNDLSLLAVDRGDERIDFAFRGIYDRAVNRLTPSFYPATLSEVLIYSHSSRVGDSIEILIGANPSGSEDISGVSFQSVNVFVRQPGQYNAFAVPNLTINSGDFVIGYRSAGFFSFDNAAPYRGRTYAAFSDRFGGGPLEPVEGNLMLRARLTRPCVTVSGVNPANAPPGASVTIAGTNFMGVNAVRFAGNVTAQFTINSDTQITTIVPSSAANGPIRLSKQGCTDAQTAAFTAASPLANVSAASFLGELLAPDSIIAAFGTRLATAMKIATTTPLPTTLEGTTVKVKDRAGVERLAQLFFVSPTQINYLMPADTTPGEATVTVTSGDGAVSFSTIQIASIVPALFTANADGKGAAAGVALRVKSDGSQIYEPIVEFDAAQNRFVPRRIDLGPEGEQVFFIPYGTGMRLRSALSAVSCSIGGVNSEVLYAGPVSGLAGLDQVNIRLSRSLIGRGEVEVALIVDGRQANLARVSFK